MKYKDLQAKAKELGLPYVGVSAEDLEVSIQKATAKRAEDSNNEGEAEPEPEAEEVKVSHDVNTAVVYDGKREVRRYSFEVHGKNFAELAKAFSQDRGYTLEFINVEPGIVCPSCGHKFSPEK